jgi:hypothetical protein
MKDLILPLNITDFDKEAWKKDEFDLPVTVEEDVRKTYYCDVLRIGHPNDESSFTVSTKAYRPVEIVIPLYSSAESTLILSIDGKEIKNFEIPATNPKKTGITYMNAHIGSSTEKKRETTLELRFRSAVNHTITLILNSAEEELCDA